MIKSIKALINATFKLVVKLGILVVVGFIGLSQLQYWVPGDKVQTVSKAIIHNTTIHSVPAQIIYERDNVLGLKIQFDESNHMLTEVALTDIEVSQLGGYVVFGKRVFGDDWIPVDVTLISGFKYNQGSIEYNGRKISTVNVPNADSLIKKIDSGKINQERMFTFI